MLIPFYRGWFKWGYLNSAFITEMDKSLVYTDSGMHFFIINDITEETSFDVIYNGKISEIFKAKA